MNTLNELLRDARQGSAPAIEALISKFSNSVEKECAKFGILQHPELSQSDLYQEVVLRVWTRIDQFNGAEEENTELIFDHWVRRTARSVLTNLLRASNAKKRLPSNGLHPFDEATAAFARNRNDSRTASSIVSRNEEVERLNGIIANHLDESAQQILNMRIVEGLSIKDISERLSLTYEQVRYKYQISLAELERRLR